MKNLYNRMFTVLLGLLILAGCTEDNEVSPLDYFLRISGSEAVSFSGLPGEELEIGVNISSSEGISSLNAGTASVPVNTGTTDTTITYTYTIAETATIGDEIDLTVTVEDADGNSASVDMTVTVGVNAASFAQIGLIDLGGEGAAEISAFSPEYDLLFVINNAFANPVINVIDVSDVSDMQLVGAYDFTGSGYGGINSVAVQGDLLAVAAEATTKTNAGTVIIFDISSGDFSIADDEVATPTVGALPDMVTFTPDGNYIVVANEGEPNDDYTIDPDGSISIIDVNGGYAVSTATFTALSGNQATYEAAGLRIFGPGASFAADLEPEYVAISANSATAYVTLQENNGVAIVDIATATVTSIVPLGFKDYSALGDAFDVTDDDDTYSTFDLTGLNVFGVYQPDALATFSVGGTNYLITANEGDAREYEGTPGFVGEDRVGDVTLDPTVYPNAATLQEDLNLGRLKLMLDLGDDDGDMDYDSIFSYGARSFSIWNATSGALVYDSENDLDIQAVAAGIYDDGRSDDKSIEPEGVVVGLVGQTTYAFIGLERVDAVAVYDISTPSAPIFVSIIKTGDAPEGLVFIPAVDSPTGTDLLVVSSEDDGTVRFYNIL